MKAFVAWVSGRPFRLILLSIVCIQLQFVSPALMVVEALLRGPVSAIRAALIVVGVFAGIALAVGEGAGALLGSTAPFLLGGAVVGGVLKWSRNLSFAFQVAVIGSIGCVAVSFLTIPELNQIGEILQTQVVLLLEAARAPPEQLALIEAQEPVWFGQVLVALWIAVMLAALLLGFWMYSTIDEGVDFGDEFRALRLGRAAGIALAVILALRVVVSADLVQYLVTMAVIAFLLQGLAVMHARARSDRWHPSILIVVYISLFTPVSPFVIMALTGAGLLDNFYALRAPVERRG